MKLKRIKVGYIGMIQLNYCGDKEYVFKRSSWELEELSKKYDFDLYIYPEPVVSQEQAEAAKNAAEQNNVDLLLVQTTSFCSGYLIQVLAKTKAYIGIWAVPETTEDGPLPLNSLCATNLSSAIITNYLKEYNIKFKWFYGYRDNEMFDERLRITLLSVRALKNLQGARVALVGGIAPGFDNFYDDERLIEKRFGVRVYRHHEFEEIKEAAFDYEISEIQEILSEIKSQPSSVTYNPDKALENHARITKAYLDLAESNRYSAIASTCWPKYRTKMDMVSCASFGLLNDMGLITVCEGDVLSAVSMLVLKYISDYVPAIMDLSNFDVTDESIFLWHCGVGSKYYAKKGTLRLEDHFNLGPFSPEKGWTLKAPVAAMEFDNMRATVMRFTHESEKMFLMSGDFFDKNSGHNGSRGWMKNLSLNGERIPVKDLINTIMVRGYHHHYPLVKGEYTDVLTELCYWLDLKLIKAEPYTSYNKPQL